MNEVADIIKKIENKNIVYHVRNGRDNTTVIRIYSSLFIPSFYEVKLHFVKPAADFSFSDIAQNIETALKKGEIRLVKDCCNFVVKIYYTGIKKEEIKGIFPTLESAKEIIEHMDPLFFGTNIPYIDAPGGLYIYGEENYKDSKKKWYLPSEIENSLIYDCSKDEVKRLDELLPYDKYMAFKTINEMKSTVTA